MAEKITATEALQNIENGVRSFRDSDEFKNYLDFAAKFHKYSANNQWWLMWQAMLRGINPVRFAGYETWQTLGRQVVKDSKAFAVLAPNKYRRKVTDEDGNETEVTGMAGFRISNRTFEYSQTEPIPGKAAWEPLEIPRMDDERADGLLQQVIELLPLWNLSLSHENTGDARGWYRPSDRHIALGTNHGLTSVELLSTLIHEVAHARVRDWGFDGMDRAQEEVVVQSVSYIVCAAYGLDTGAKTFMYVGTWIDKDFKSFKAALGAIQKIADKMIEEIGEVVEQPVEMLAA
jgi:antirestriction protein ArdC